MTSPLAQARRMSASLADPGFAALRRNELIGRPLGDRAFLDAVGHRLGRGPNKASRHAQCLDPNENESGTSGCVKP